MRISLIGPVYPYRGGIAHYTSMLTNELRARNHEVLMVSFKRQYPKWLYPGRSNKDPSKKILAVDKVKYWIDSINPVTWVYTFVQIFRFKPDIIILQWWTPFWALVWTMIGILNRLFLGVPLIFICHNVLPHESKFYDKWITRIVFRQGNHFIVHSESEKELLVKIHPNAISDIIPLPVFDMFSDQRIEKEIARSTLDLPERAYILLFFGIVRKYKGLMDLLTALPIIQKQLGNVILVVAGEFWDDKEPYLDRIKELGIEEFVILHDYYIPNEQVGLFFSAADLLIAPYRKVTGSAVVQMAKGFNLPVLMTQLNRPLGFDENVDARKVIIYELASNTVDFLKKSNKSLLTDSTHDYSWSHLISGIKRIYINAKS